MNTSKIAVLITQASIIKKYKGNWSFASQQTVLSLLKKCHDTVIKRRQLGYHLADLRREGLIKTIKRTRRDPDGTVCLLSSATCLTMKGCVFLYRLGQVWALKHLNNLRSKYHPTKPSPPKRETAIKAHAEPIEHQEDGRFLDPDFRERIGLDPLPAFLRPLKA